MPCSANGLDAGEAAQAVGAPGSDGRRHSARPRLIGSAGLVLLLFATALLSACGSEHQDGFKIVNITTRSHQGQRLVDARVNFNFSNDAREALENGVALSVFVDLELQTQGNLWETTLASRSAGQRIHIYALSKQYQVKDLTTGQSRTYRSFKDMAANIGNIKNLYLIDEQNLSSDQKYRVRARARLDIESLPSPLRPLAYFSTPWQLSSDWTTWPFQP